MTYNDFKQKNAFSLTDRKPLDLVYADMGYKMHIVTDLHAQKHGVDIALKMSKHTPTIYVDEKIQRLEYKHKTHVLLEHSSYWNNTGKLSQIGWAFDDKLWTHWLADFCVETGWYFIYDAKALKGWAQQNLSDLENLPNSCFSPTPAMNLKMHTKNVICARKYLEPFLVNVGVVKNGEIVL